MKTTKENNRLIAEFMGFDLSTSRIILPHELSKSTYSSSVFIDEVRIQSGEKPNSVNNMHFHTSFDWLMPVVEKIEDLECSVNISSSMVYINKEGGAIVKPISIGFGTSKIQAIYQAVIQFIEWYNEQK